MGRAHGNGDTETSEKKFWGLNHDKYDWGGRKGIEAEIWINVENAKEMLKDDSEPWMVIYRILNTPFLSPSIRSYLPDLENQGKYHKYKSKQTQQINRKIP